MANEQLFSGRAQNYALARPAYAKEAVDRMLQIVCGGKIAADIGAGTGILTAAFIERGLQVWAVEPNAEMRAQMQKNLAGQTGFTPVAASAEHTGLAPCSVDLVAAASAFHWFDADGFRAECKRILKPGGAVCILLNVRQYDAFTQKQHAVCQRYCKGFSSLAHGYEKTKRKMDSFFAGGYREESFPHPLEYSVEKFVQRSLSSSYAPLKGSTEYESFVRETTALAEEAAVDGKLCVANHTVLFWGKMEESV